MDNYIMYEGHQIFLTDEQTDRLKDLEIITDYDLMHQRALHETLNRLLWQFSIENDCDKTQQSNEYSKKWYVYYDRKYSKFNIIYTFRLIHMGTVYFPTKELAGKALDEIVRPFIQAHPEYKI